MADVGELVVRIKADAAQLERELKRMQGITQQSANKMGGAFGFLTGQIRGLLPALSAAAFVSFAKRAVDTAGSINDLAGRIGFAASTLSALEPALATNGSSLEDFAASIGILNNSLGEAAKGNQEAVKAFDQLGLSVRKLQQMSPEERFYAVTEALMKLGDQAKITEAGRNLLGRGFLAMLPTLQEYNGKIKDAVDNSKQLGDALGPETIQRIDAFGDALQRAAIKARNEFLDLLAAILKVSDAVADSFGQGGLGTGGPGNPRGFAGAKIGVLPQDAARAAWLEKAKAAGFVTEASVAGTEQFGPFMPKKSARGGNAGLIKPEANPVRDYLRKLEQENSRLKIPQPERAGQQAVDELKNAAAEKNIKLTRQQIDLARELGKANYEMQNPNPVKEYTEKLEQEGIVLRANAKDREGLKDVFELENQLRKDGITLSDQEKQKIMEVASANEELRKTIEENERVAKQMHDQLRDGLTDVILHFNSAKDAAKGFFEEIAKQILNKKITTPLADSLLGKDGDGGLLGGLFNGSESARPSPDFVGPMPSSGGIFSGIGSMLGFADGGRPPLGKPSVVGERGPEIWWPDTAGSVIPNHALGGKSVQVTQVIQMSPGLQGTVEAEVRRAAPAIAAAAKAAVFSSIERGGREAALVGRKS